MIIISSLIDVWKYNLLNLNNHKNLIEKAELYKKRSKYIQQLLGKNEDEEKDQDEKQHQPLQKYHTEAK